MKIIVKELDVVDSIFTLIKEGDVCTVTDVMENEGLNGETLYRVENESNDWAYLYDYQVEVVEDDGRRFRVIKLDRADEIISRVELGDICKPVDILLNEVDGKIILVMENDKGDRIHVYGDQIEAV